MSSMELEIYEALTAVNVPAIKAKAVAASIDKAIDRRYSLHAEQLATRSDIADVKKEMAEAKADIIKWCVASIFGAVALFAAIVKVL